MVTLNTTANKNLMLTHTNANLCKYTHVCVCNCVIVYARYQQKRILFRYMTSLHTAVLMYLQWLLEKSHKIVYCLRYTKHSCWTKNYLHTKYTHKLVHKAIHLNNKLSWVARASVLALEYTPPATRSSKKCERTFLFRQRFVSLPTETCCQAPPTMFSNIYLSVSAIQWMNTWKQR